MSSRSWVIVEALGRHRRPYLELMSILGGVGRQPLHSDAQHIAEALKVGIRQANTTKTKGCKLQLRNRLGIARKHSKSVSGGISWMDMEKYLRAHPERRTKAVKMVACPTSLVSVTVSRLRRGSVKYSKMVATSKLHDKDSNESRVKVSVCDAAGPVVRTGDCCHLRPGHLGFDWEYAKFCLAERWGILDHDCVNVCIVAALSNGIERDEAKNRQKCVTEIQVAE
ncbi:hypothetical protein B0H19DRAFT_1324983 [Mycena capillaripes]|nr:hypothetical protein B0H19DRAFT_1324983 [Mycena capillaripes]